MKPKPVIKEVKKGEAWRKGYMQGCKETAKAFGGCKRCYGKGYATQLETAYGEDEWDGTRVSIPQPYYLPCSCNRGEQFEEAMSIMRKDTPMGVSQWVAHGKKYGYAAFTRGKKK